MHNKRKEYPIDLTLSNQFAHYMSKYPELYASLAHKVHENIPSTPENPVIIDLGIGPGILIKKLRDRIPNARIIGIDPSPEMIHFASQNNKHDRYLTVLLGRAEKIPLTTASVDTTVTRFSLSSWTTPHDGFKEIHRVLKPGGRLILETLNKDFPRWKLLLIKFRMLSKHAGKQVIDYHVNSYSTAFSLDQVEQFLRHAGFTIITKEYKHHDWKFLVIAEKP